MEQFKVKPLYDSDWRGINEATVAGKMETMACMAGPGKTLPPVRASKTYYYRGEFPANFPANQTMPPPFAVYEIEEISN